MQKESITSGRSLHIASIPATLSIQKEKTLHL